MRMKTEYQKMLDGEVYSAVDKELLEMLNRVKDLCWEYNQIRPTLIKERNLKLREILGKMENGTPATSGRGRSTSATTAGLAVAQLSCLE